MADDPTAGHNPPYGVALSYWLKSSPSRDVALTIADEAGKTVRQMKGTKTPGINRVYWDLRFDPSAPESPGPVASAVPTPPSGPEEGPPVTQGPPLSRRNAPPPAVRLLAPPGRYTVTLQVGGKRASQSFEVIKDPSSGGSLHEIQLQTAMLESLSVDLNKAGALTAGIENFRHQLEALLAGNANRPAEPELRNAEQALNQKFADLAEKLQQQKQVPFFEWPVELTAKFVYLVNHVQSSDRRPTDQAREAYGYLQDQLRLVTAEYESLTQKDLGELNTQLERKGSPIILTTRH
jgi:hypothetical protein